MAIRLLSGENITGNITVSGTGTFGSSITVPGAISAGANGGLRIHSSGTKFFNVTAANAARTNIMDIGAPDARFKDLYLGGSITSGGGATFTGTVQTTGVKTPYIESVSTNQSLFLYANGSGHIYFGDSTNGTNLYHYSSSNDGKYTSYGFDGNYYSISTTATSGVKINDPLLVIGSATITNTGANPRITLIENSGGTQNAVIEFDQAGENALYISTNYISPSDSNRILLQPGSYPALTASGGANGSVNTKVEISGTLRANRNIQTPNSDLSTGTNPTNFGVYTSEVRLIDTPNGGLKSCRVITDNYGEWILVGRYAASAMSAIQTIWSSVSGLSLDTTQSATTQFSADFGDSYPTEVRIMGSTDFTKWRDTRTIDFIYGVPEGRAWKFFFSGGATNGMTSVGPNHSGNNKFGWNINGSYDGFGRWANPLQTSVGMSDANVTNPSAAYTTATTNAFNWEVASDAKMTVTATRTFSGQDSFETAGFGNDDNIQGFFDEYPNETNNMQGGVDFSSAVWVLIKLPTAISSGSGGGSGNQWAGGPTTIHNTNTGSVGIGTSNPGLTGKGLEIQNIGNDTTASLKLTGHNNTGTPGAATSTELKHIGDSLKFVINHAGTDALSIGSSASTIGFTLANTTELGTYPQGAVKRVRMAQGGEIHFGDTTTTAPLGVTEGVWDNFGDQDSLGIYSRNHFSVYSYGGTYSNPKLRIDDAGSYFQGSNFGIGTTSPAQPLSVHGNFLVRTTNADGNKNRMQCIVGGSSDAANLYLYYGNTGDGTVSVRLNAQGDSYLNGGNVGIGTSSPSAKLEVRHPSYANTNETAIFTNGNLSGRIIYDTLVVSQTDVATISLVETPGTAAQEQKLTFSVGDNKAVIRTANTSSGMYFNVQASLTAPGYQATSGLTGIHIKNNGEVIMSAGNVGIGTSSPNHKLEVAGRTYIEFQGTNWNETTPGLGIGSIHLDPTGSGADNTGNAITFGASDHANGTVADAGIYTRSDGAYGTKMYFATTDSYAVGSKTRMMIDSNGNVGIGTTSPSFQLSIENHDTTTSTGTMELDGKRTNGTDGPVGEMIFSNNGDTFATVAGYRDTADNRGALYFQTQGASGFSTKMIIRNSARIEMSADVTMSGSVGIGETTLQRKFNLYDGTDTWTRVQCGASTADWLHGIAGSDHTYKWYNQSSNGGVGYKMALATSGTLTVSADLVAYGSPSDKRLKENIKPIESALDKVSKLQGVTFDWKKSDSILDIKEDIGFIAQDVQKVIPELVRENNNGMLSMRHQGIAPILLEAIKELKAEIEELKKQIK